MKKLSLFVLVALLSVSCSTFDKYKTPVAPDGGVAEGEKSSYLLNKPEEAKPAEAKAKTSTKKKKAIKKVTK